MVLDSSRSVSGETVNVYCASYVSLSYWRKTGIEPHVREVARVNLIRS
jgi:hypothetical protein